MVNRQQQRRRPGGRRFFPRRKVCQFCVDKVTNIEYKDAPRLRRLISDWGKIESRRKTGTCAPHQRQLSLAIKRARYLAMLPYTGSHSLMELARFDPRGDRRRDRGGPDGGRPEGGRPYDGGRPDARPERPAEAPVATAPAEAATPPTEATAPVAEAAAPPAEATAPVAEAAAPPAEAAAPVAEAAAPPVEDADASDSDR